MKVQASEIPALPLQPRRVAGNGDVSSDQRTKHYAKMAELICKTRGRKEYEKVVKMFEAGHQMHLRPDWAFVWARYHQLPWAVELGSPWR